MKKILYVFLSVGLLFSCQKDQVPTSEPEHHVIIPTCPTDSDQVSWESGEPIYGTWRFLHTGYDGNSSWYSAATHDSIINLHTTCGCPYYGNHMGGTGNTYMVYLGDTAVIFQWANGHFAWFTLLPKWLGATEKGIKMGDTLSTFLQKYPSFSMSTTDSTQYLLTRSGILITAWFTDKSIHKGLLKQLQVYLE